MFWHSKEENYIQIAKKTSEILKEFSICKNENKF